MMNMSGQKNIYTSNIKLLVLLCLALLPSCKKEINYPFRIVNATSYSLNNIRFSGAMSGNELSLNANDTSDLILLSYEKRLRLTPKLICITFTNPTDTIESSTNSRLCTPFDKKDLNETENWLSIHEEITPDSVWFSTKLH
mgnify:CR=1 FL=1